MGFPFRYSHDTSHKLVKTLKSMLWCPSDPPDLMHHEVRLKHYMVDGRTL